MIGFGATEQDDEYQQVGQEEQFFDELVELIKYGSLDQLVPAVEIKDRFYHLKKYKCCFVGSAFVTWMLAYHPYANIFANDRSKVVEYVQSNLMNKWQVLHHVVDLAKPFIDGDFFYRLQMDEESQALNLQKVKTSASLSPSYLAAKLRTTLIKIFGKFLSTDGRSVNYEGMKASAEFRRDYLPIAQVMLVVLY